MHNVYDVAIVGAGPAGMTAAIYAGRQDKKVIVLDREGIGGNIAKSPKVENIPGFTSISGSDFAENMYNQMLSNDSVEHYINEVKTVSYKNGLFQLLLDDNSVINALSVIVATGSTPKELKLDTKNIYYCVTCDGPFFKGKDVVVVGSGNTGAAYALELATYCNKVYMFDVTENMCCEKNSQTLINNTKNIEWLGKKFVKQVINNNDNLSKIEFSDGTEINCDAIFSAIGFNANTSLLNNYVSLDTYNYALTDENMESNLKGLFVAGDCRHKAIRQVTTAVNDGTIAAINAIKYLNNRK